MYQGIIGSGISTPFPTPLLITDLSVGDMLMVYHIHYNISY